MKLKRRAGGGRCQTVAGMDGTARVALATGFGCAPPPRRAARRLHGLPVLNAGGVRLGLASVCSVGTGGLRGGSLSSTEWRQSSQPVVAAWLLAIAGQLMRRWCGATYMSLAMLCGLDAADPAGALGSVAARRSGVRGLAPAE